MDKSSFVDLLEQVDRMCNESKIGNKIFLSLALDGPHNSHLQQHRHPHSHRGRRFNPDQFLRLLRSLQREPVYDRDCESDLDIINMKLKLSLSSISSFCLP